jgi:hypothetical protein
LLLRASIPKADVQSPTDQVQAEPTWPAGWVLLQFPLKKKQKNEGAEKRKPLICNPNLMTNVPANFKARIQNSVKLQPTGVDA